MVRSQLLDAVCRKIFVKCGAAYFDLVNDVTNEWVVFGVHKHGFGVFDVLLVHGFWPPMSWAHINMLGEYDFSEEKLRDTLGILPPKKVA